MRLRALAVTTALALAATGLSACTSKIGQAATVGSHRISQSDVSSYVNPNGPTAAAVSSGGVPPAPKVVVVNLLVQTYLLRAVLSATKGGVPSATTLASKYHDSVANQYTQGSGLTGAAFDKAFGAQLVADGLRANFLSLLVTHDELEFALIERLQLKSQAQFAAALKATKLSVSINPRYGAWDPTKGSMSATSGAGLPSFVTIGSDTAVSASPTAGQ